MPESRFVKLSLFVFELACMFPGAPVFELLQRPGIEFLKKAIDFDGLIIPQPQPDPVVMHSASLAGHPANAVNGQLKERYSAERSVFGQIAQLDQDLQNGQRKLIDAFAPETVRTYGASTSTTPTPAEFVVSSSVTLAVVI